MSLIQKVGNTCLSTSNIETQVTTRQSISNSPKNLEINDSKFNSSEKNVLTSTSKVIEKDVATYEILYSYKNTQTKQAEPFLKTIEDLKAFQIPEDKDLELKLNCENQIKSIMNTLEGTEFKNKSQSKISEMVSAGLNGGMINPNPEYRNVLFHYMAQCNNSNMNVNLYPVNISPMNRNQEHAYYSKNLQQFGGYSNGTQASPHENGNYYSQIIHEQYPSQYNGEYYPVSYQLNENHSNIAENSNASGANGKSQDANGVGSKGYMNEGSYGVNSMENSAKKATNLNKSPSPAHMNIKGHLENRMNIILSTPEGDNQGDENENDENAPFHKNLRGYRENMNGIQKKKKVRLCYNKLCLTDPNDSSQWSKTRIEKSMICRICEDAYRNNQFCAFCHQIYLDSEISAVTDDKDWIECEICKCWQHIECEQEHGIKTIRVLLKEKEKTYKYMCPNCRPKHSNKAANKKKPLGKAFTFMTSGMSQAKQKIARKYLNKAPSYYSHDQTNDTTNPVSNTEEYAEGELPTKKLHKELELTESLVKLSPENSHLNNGNNSSTNNKPPGITEFQASPPVMIPLHCQLSQDELIRKRIESIFNKNQVIKRRFQPRVLGHPNDGYSTIENLLNQYGKKYQLNETEIRHDISLLREISKSTSGTTSNLQEDKSGEDEDFAYDSSGGKNDAPEENTPKNNVVDEDFRPGRYDKRNVRSSTKIQSFRKYSKQKNLYRTNGKADEEGSNAGNEVELSESNNVNTSMTSNGNNVAATNNNNHNSSSNNMNNNSSSNNINNNNNTSNNNNSNGSNNTTSKDTNINNGINKRQLRSRKKPE